MLLLGADLADRRLGDGRPANGLDLQQPPVGRGQRQALECQETQDGRGVARRSSRCRVREYKLYACLDRGERVRCDVVFDL
jgi:hypothetical protein